VRFLDWSLDFCAHLLLPWQVLSAVSWLPIAVIAEGLQVPGRSLIEVFWPVALITGPVVQGAMIGLWLVRRNHR
jgi:hypothetical protein